MKYTKADTAIIKNATIGNGSTIWHYANLYDCKIGITKLSPGPIIPEYLPRVNLIPLSYSVTIFIALNASTISTIIIIGIKTSIAPSNNVNASAMSYLLFRSI